MKTKATSNATVNLTVSPVHVDIDNEVTEGRPALALLPNKSEEEINNNDETMGGTVILMYAGLTEYSNHRIDWVVYYVSENIIQYLIITGPTRKEPPKPRLMAMEEIDSDEAYDPNNDK